MPFPKKRTRNAANKTADNKKISLAVSAAGRENAIRARAYELFQERNCEHGGDLDDWLRAEAELRERQLSR